VINFDIPYDTESYTHRIGRTGRAGRKGKALLFVTPREHRLLKDIERATQKPIKQIEPPSLKEMREMRDKALAQKVINIIEKSKKLKPYHETVENIMAQGDCAPQDVAAALAYLLQQSNPLSSEEIVTTEPESEKRRSRKPSRPRGKSFSFDKPRSRRKPSSGAAPRKSSGKRKSGPPKSGRPPRRK